MPNDEYMPPARSFDDERPVVYPVHVAISPLRSIRQDPSEILQVKEPLTVRPRVDFQEINHVEVEPMKQKILVLDDSPFMLTIIGDMLKRLNYEVTALDNGNDACRKVESGRFDMIITDLNMPAMDGLEFTKKVRSYPKCRFVPIVMLSSETDGEKVAKAKQLGISTFLRKPPNEAQLKTLLQITLSKRKAPRIPIKLEVYYGESEKSAGYTSGYTFNMSIGGLFLETGCPLSPGVKLKLKFSHPENDAPIICQGRVAWVNSPTSPVNKDHPAGMGVEFVDLEEERHIQELLRSRPLKS